MAINQKFKEYRVNSLPSSNLQAGDRYYLNVGKKQVMYIVSDSLELIRDNSSEFIEKDTIQELRDLSLREIWALQNNIYKGVKLNGYYAKGDTTAPIEYYLSNTTDSDDGGSVFKVGGIKLKHDFVGQINVKYFGAKGNGISDDTLAIQNCLDLKKDVYFPLGTYQIKAHDESRDPNGIGYLIDKGGIALQSNTVITFEKGTLLRPIDSNHNAYNIVRIVNKDNIKINNLSMLGDRDTNTSTNGEWGYGLAILGSRNITINNIRSDNMWGDGINIQVLAVGHAGVTKLTPCENITTIVGVCNNNRRQGLSIESGINLFFDKVTFSKTNGTAPEFGVDIEPWSEDNIVKDVIFTDCIFDDNASGGFLVWGDGVSNVQLNNCIFKGKHYQHYSTGRQPKNVILNNCFFSDEATRSVNIRGGETIFNNCNINSLIQINESADDIIFITERVVFNNSNINKGLGTDKKCKYLEINKCNITNMLYSESLSTVVRQSVFNKNSTFVNPNDNELLLDSNVFRESTGSVQVSSNSKIISNTFIQCTGVCVKFIIANIKNIRAANNTFIDCTGIKIDFQDIFSNNENIDLIDNISNNGDCYVMNYITGGNDQNNNGLLSRTGNKLRHGGNWFVKNPTTESKDFISEGESIVNILNNNMYIKKNGSVLPKPVLGGVVSDLPQSPTNEQIVSKINELLIVLRGSSHIQ